MLVLNMIGSMNSLRTKRMVIRLVRLDLVVKGQNRFVRAEILLPPLGIVERIPIQQHHESLKFDIADLLRENRKALAFQLRVCHFHKNLLKVLDGIRDAHAIPHLLLNVQLGNRLEQNLDLALIVERPVITAVVKIDSHKAMEIIP